MPYAYQPQTGEVVLANPLDPELVKLEQTAHRLFCQAKDTLSRLVKASPAGTQAETARRRFQATGNVGAAIADALVCAIQTQLEGTPALKQQMYQAHHQKEAALALQKAFFMLCEARYGSPAQDFHGLGVRTARNAAELAPGEYVLVGLTDEFGFDGENEKEKAE